MHAVSSAAVFALLDMQQLRAAIRPPLPVGGAVHRPGTMMMEWWEAVCGGHGVGNESVRWWVREGSGLEGGGGF